MAWIEDEREAFAIRRHLTAAAAAWEQLGRDPSELYSGPRLVALLDWLKTGPTLSASERAFADASRAESERVERGKARSVRRLRILAAAVSVALVVALGAGAFALVKQRDAADSRDRADIARVAAVSRSVVERQPDLGLLLAVAAFDLDDNDETRGALLEGLQTHPLLFGSLPRPKVSTTRQIRRGLAALAPQHRHLGAARGMTADRRIDGAVRAGRRAPYQRQIAALELAGPAMVGELLGKRAWARSVLATTSSPLVSLSRRCTMPGRATPPMPERLCPQWAISALTSVPVHGRRRDGPRALPACR